MPRPGRSLLSKGEGLTLHRKDAPVTWSTLAMAMVPAVVSGVSGYLPEILSDSSRSHKAALIRANTSRTLRPRGRAVI